MRDDELKSLYVSKKYFEDFPEKSKLAMMSDGEIYFFQLDGNIDNLIKEYPDIKEVVQLDEDLLIICRDVEKSHIDELIFEEMVAKYSKGIIVHNQKLKF